MANEASRTTQAALLRTVYRPKMRLMFNLKSILLQYLTRNTTSGFAEGDKISISIHKGQSGGWGFSSAGHLPDSDYQKVARANFNYTRVYGKIRIPGPMMQSTSDVPVAAEAKVYDLETTNLVKQLRSGLNFHMFGDGSGKVAAIVTAPSATTFTVDDVRGIVNGGRYDVLLIANGAVGGGVRKATVSVNVSTKLVTMDAAFSFADGTGAAVNAAPTTYALYQSGSYNDAVLGLDAVIATGNPTLGNYGGIDRTAAGNEYWQGNVLSNSGVPRRASFPLISEAVDQVTRYSDGEINLAICGYEVHRQLMNELIAARRVENNTKKLNGWATAIMHDDIPLVRDKHCDPTKMYLLDTSHWELFQDSEGDWMSEDGAILSRVPGEDAYDAAWKRYLQPVCDAPNTQAVITDLDTTPVVA
jgi:hypothetical protein